jgi:hypothetical protein
LGHQSCRDSSDASTYGPRDRGEEDAFYSLLVTSETNQHPLEVQSHAQRCVHQAVDRQRSLIVDALWESSDSALKRRAEKIGLCCVAPMIFADSDSMPVCVAGYCRDRLCPTCMRRRAFKVRQRLCSLVSSMNAPRFLTLTERDNSDPLSVRMDRITAAVRKLRHTKEWKRHVVGGVMVWETTRNEKAGTWHPHVHLIIDGEFWSHSSLLSAWKAALGSDGTARIEACHDRNKSARYLAKYLAKDSELAAWPAKTIEEFATAMHRRRLVATFGRMHKLNVDLCDGEKEKPKLPRASLSYETIRSAIDAGDGPARSAAPLLARLGIAFRQLFFEFSMPGECYADELSASQFSQLGEWIEELDAAQRGVEKIEAASPPIADTRTLSLFPTCTEYR